METGMVEVFIPVLESSCAWSSWTNESDMVFSETHFTYKYGSGHEGGSVLLPGFAIIW